MAGTDPAECEYLRGKALSGLERDSEAIDAFTLALERRPDWPEVLLARAAAKYSTASPDCLYDLERLTELQPGARFGAIGLNGLLGSSTTSSSSGENM